MPEKFKLDFVGIGAAKSGTTWLAACLEEHPEICLSKKKELHYFTRESVLGMSGSYDLGESWLCSHFRHCQVGQIRGEYSVFYHIDPASPNLIKCHNPDIKLIASFRNPTERLQSLYYTMATQHSLQGTFEQFAIENEHFKETGLYYAHLRRFTDVFPQENLFVIIYDDIVKKPERILCNLYTFLGVDPGFLPPILNERVNLRRQVRWPLMRNSISAITNFLNHTRGIRWLLMFQRKFKLNFIRDWLLRLNTKPATTAYDPMSEEIRGRLCGYYAESNLKLGELLGIDLSHWNE